jgi:hypothetical protein
MPTNIHVISVKVGVWRPSLCKVLFVLILIFFTAVFHLGLKKLVPSYDLIPNCQSVGHISGPVGCIHNLTFRNVTVGAAGSARWTGCHNVDLASFIQDGVSPKLTCSGCKGTH